MFKLIPMSPSTYYHYMVKDILLQYTMFAFNKKLSALLQVKYTIWRNWISIRIRVRYGRNVAVIRMGIF